MKRQAKSYWCGVASIANALEVLGIKRSQREIERLCHVSPAAGTDEVEMKRALLAQGVKVDEYHTVPPVPGEACSWLYSHLERRGPAILCVDDDEHWVTAIGFCARETVLIFDPARNVGIEVHTWSTLGPRWVNSDGIFYGIGVST